MVRVLLLAGQFAHLTEADFHRSLDDLWDVDQRMDWLSGGHGATAYQASTWAERAVSISLVKAAETGLIPRDYFDAQTVDWVARTEPTMCCLCLALSGEAFGGIYSIPLNFVSYVCPTFLRIDAPYFVRRPFCGKCSWAVSHWVGWASDQEDVSRDELSWDAALAHLLTLPAFRQRVRDHAENIHRLRFDPRRAQPQQVAA